MEIQHLTKANQPSMATEVPSAHWNKLTTLNPSLVLLEPTTGHPSPSLFSYAPAIHISSEIYKPTFYNHDISNYPLEPNDTSDPFTFPTQPTTGHPSPSLLSYAPAIY